LSTIPEIKIPVTENETGKLIHEIDWANTPLGPVSTWPQSRITAIAICLNSAQPLTVLFGKELIQIYNEAYSKLIGTNHPSAFGKSCKESWSALWHLLGPIFEEHILKKGESTFLNDQFMLLNRNGFIEETYFSSNFTPIPDENHTINGVFCTLRETTAEVLNKRRGKLLAQLSESVSQAQTMDDILKGAISIFKTAERDIPYATVYMLSKNLKKAERVAHIGLPDNHEMVPNQIDLTVHDYHANSFNKAIFSNDIIVLNHNEPLKDNEVEEFKGKISNSLLFPVRQKAGTDPVAILMIGLNPYLELADSYMNFFKAILVQLENGINVLNTSIENKRSDKKLRDSEDHYRLATEVTNLATWDLNLATFELTHSPRFAEILGYDSNKILTHQLMHDHIHPEDLYPVVERAFDRALQTAVYNYDSRIIWPDKTLHWIRTQGKVLYDDKNIPIRMIGIMMDITEFKNAEQALRESEKRFRAVADTAPVMIWMTDRERNCIFLNKCWSDMTGLSIAEGLKKGWTFIVHPDDYPATSQKFIKAYESHAMYTHELRIKDKQGNYIWIMDHAVPRYSAEGFFLGYIGSSVNINEQKNAKEVLENKVIERTLELKMANEELRKTNKELEQFAYVSSHDLQEPLRKIQTFSELLFNKIDKDAPEHVYLEKINSSALRMSELIRDLLNLSKVSNVDEEFVETDLSKIIENVKMDFELLIKEKQAEFYMEKLPVVKAIPIQMNQLFYNLLGNALKFSERKPVVKISCVEVTASQLKLHGINEEAKGKNYIKITVEDNGVGFDQNYADQIFVIFQRLNDRSKFAGTGIGLAICKKIVENHNGFIVAKSKINEGSTFHIFLPK
jgi:hypothetical protein